jgi:alkyl sulfatase BDS1-like metallo-beta-lactamase superfamily hydrolase
MFDSIAIRVDGPEAWDHRLRIDITFTDLHESYRLTLRNGVLIHERRDAAPGADATVTTTKLRLLARLGGDATSPGIEVTGDPTAVATLFGVLQAPDPDFAIVTPD